MYNFHIDLSLYLVTDRKFLRNRDLPICIEQAIAGGVTAVQLREKEISTREFFDIAVKVKAVTDKYRIPLIINDRLDIAMAIDADGLHIGKDDLPVAVARNILGDKKILGVSATDLKEALIAQKDGADYLGVGAVFPTDTKPDAQNVNIKMLGEIKSQVTIPVVAIGGINKNNVRIVMKEMVDGIAIVSAILDQDDIMQASRSLRDTAFNSLDNR